jgi:DNA gyrase subunit A
MVLQDVEHFSEADLVAHQATVISYSRAGYIKRMPLATYRTQHRGGKGIKAMQTREEDAVRHLLVADTHDNLLLFTDRGRIFNLMTHEIEERTREWRGLPIRNLIQIDPGENVTAIISVVAFDKDFLLLGTRNGQIKKTALAAFASVRRAGLIAFKLRRDDELVLATTAHAEDDVVVASSGGLAVRFAVQSLRGASRASGGVRGIRIPNGATMVGLVAVKKDNEFLTITANGFGKRTPEAEYPRKGRGGKGMIAHKVTNRTGPLVALRQVDGEEDLVLISAAGKFVRTTVASIAQVGRSTQGVTVMRTDDGIDVAAIALVDLSREYGEGPESTPPSDSGNGNGLAHAAQPAGDAPPNGDSSTRPTRRAIPTARSRKVASAVKATAKPRSAAKSTQRGKRKPAAKARKATRAAKKPAAKAGKATRAGRNPAATASKRTSSTAKKAAAKRRKR